MSTRSKATKTPKVDRPDKSPGKNLGSGSYESPSVTEAVDEGNPDPSKDPIPADPSRIPGLPETPSKPGISLQVQTPKWMNPLTEQRVQEMITSSITAAFAQHGQDTYATVQMGMNDFMEQWMTRIPAPPFPAGPADTSMSGALPAPAETKPEPEHTSPVPPAESKSKKPSLELSSNAPDDSPSSSSSDSDANKRHHRSRTRKHTRTIKPKELTLFDPSYGDGTSEVYTSPEGVVHTDVYAWTDQLTSLAHIHGTRAVKHSWPQALRGSAYEWYTFDLDSSTKAEAREWTFTVLMDWIIDKNKPSISECISKLESSHYDLHNVRKGEHVTRFARRVMTYARNAGFTESGQMSYAWNKLDVKLVQPHIDKPRGNREYWFDELDDKWPMLQGIAAYQRPRFNRDTPIPSVERNTPAYTPPPAIRPSMPPRRDTRFTPRDTTKTPPPNAYLNYADTSTKPQEGSRVAPKPQAGIYYVEEGSESSDKDD